MSDDAYDWEKGAQRATVSTVVSRLVRQGFHQGNMPTRDLTAVMLSRAGLPIRDVDAVLAELGEVLDDPFPGMH